MHLITELNMGGAEQMLLKVVTRMARSQFRCLVVSMTDSGPVGEKIIRGGIPVYSLGMGLGRPSMTGIGRLFRLLRKESVDILQTWLYHADLMGLLVGKATGLKRIVWGIRCSNMHLRNYRPLTALTVRLGGLFSPLPSAIVVNSMTGKDVHRRRGYKTDRMVFIPNGFDMEMFHPERAAREWILQNLGLSAGVCLIGLVARFDPMKDQRTFMKAAAILSERDDSSRFLLIGRGMEWGNLELVRLVDEFGMRGKVHLLGEREDVARLTAGMDIATSSSAYGEGFPNTLGEAMACGVPCVTTDVGDAAVIVGDGGVSVPVRDPEAMAGAWLRLLRMGQEGRWAMGEQGRARVRDKYEIGKVVRRFEDLYRILCAEK